MSSLLSIAAAAAAVCGVFVLLRRRFEERSAVELVAVLRLLTLIAVAMLPIALAVCAATILGAQPHGGCGLGAGASRGLSAALYALAAAVALRLAWVAVRKVRATRAVTVPGLVLRRVARLQPAAGRPVVVLPVDEPLAYAAGFGRGQVVVSRGLLDRLDAGERKALLAHELAHLRGGHQRMLLVGEVVVGAFGFLPPVRNAFASLRRALEMAADARAVEATGDPRLVARAIAKAALAAPVAVVPLAAQCDLRDRLERLLDPRPPSRRASAAVAAAGALVAGAVVLSLCLAVHAGALPLNLLACLGSLAVLALPPLVPSRGQASVGAPCG